MVQGILLITKLIRKRAVMRSLVHKHAGALCGLELCRPGEDRWVVILPDLTGQPGCYKVQHLDCLGLGNHSCGYPTPEAALRFAISAGYTEEAPGIMKKLSATPHWKALYRTGCASKNHVERAPSLPCCPKTSWKITPELRRRMIEEAAYFRAEHRGFQGDHAVQDWLEAESEINRLYSTPPRIRLSSESPRFAGAKQLVDSACQAVV